MNKLHSLLILFNILVGSVLTFDWTTVGLAPHTASVIGGLLLMAANALKLGLNATGNGATGVK